MQVQPYLIFEGRCEKALEFYGSALGAEVTTLMRFRESPYPGTGPPAAEVKVMHANFRIGNTAMMASDGSGKRPPGFQGFSLSLSSANEPEAERLFTALSGGRQVKMPLAGTFWSPLVGTVVDRFGVSWMIHVTP
jgi:PhnB protein